VVPADSITAPPEPLLLVPTSMLTEPPEPFVAKPVASVILPELPDKVVPLLSDTTPDVPEESALAEPTVTEPVLLHCEPPDCKMREPPT